MTRAALIVIVISLAMAAIGKTPAAAQTESANCWQELIGNGLGGSRTVVYCSIGGTASEYSSWGEAGGSVGPLSPDVGYDASGTECWFRTTRSTNWVMVAQNTDGTALLGWDPDGIPGGALALDVNVPRCTSEPTEGEVIENLAWDIISSYMFEVPTPSFNPDGIGITGLATFIALDPPPFFTDSIVSPISGRRVTVEISVAAVIVDWDDGTVDTYTESSYPLLTGYPSGIADHIYETKNFYDITVDYEWFIRWNVDGGTWSTIFIPNTTTDIPYRVDEIVTRNSG